MTTSGIEPATSDLSRFFSTNYTTACCPTVHRGIEPATSDLSRCLNQLHNRVPTVRRTLKHYREISTVNFWLRWQGAPWQIGGSGSGTAEYWGVSWCEAVLLGEWLVAFRRIVMQSSSSVKQHNKNRLLPFEFESSTFVRNFGYHSHNDTSSHPRRSQSSEILFCPFCKPAVTLFVK
jgi:hypothetical protein